jgi:ornithine carbamoyltransferase
MEERIDLLLRIRSSVDLMKAAAAQVKFMHCRPRSRPETVLGKQIAETYGISNGLEVTNDVFSRVQHRFPAGQAACTVKPILVATLGE